MSTTLHGSDAFTHSPDCGWCVNSDVYQDRPRMHSNVEAPSSRGCSINIDVYLAAPKDVERHRCFARKGERIRVVVDSGATHSICRSEVADVLGIQRNEITKGRRKRFKLLPGSSQVCCQYNLCIRFGDKYQDFEVYWPVQITQRVTPEGMARERYRLVNNIPSRGNLLGMMDILGSNMLCLTPEKVFVFPIRRSQEKKQDVRKEIPIEIRVTPPAKSKSEMQRPSSIQHRTP